MPWGNQGFMNEQLCGGPPTHLVSVQVKVTFLTSPISYSHVPRDLPSSGAGEEVTGHLALSGVPLGNKSVLLQGQRQELCRPAVSCFWDEVSVISLTCRPQFTFSSLACTNVKLLFSCPMPIFCMASLSWDPNSQGGRGTAVSPSESSDGECENQT